VVGGGIAGGLLGVGTIGWSIVELLKEEPGIWSRLLVQWGPWAFFSALCVWCLNTWILANIRARERTDERLAVVFDRVAAGLERSAKAAEENAEGVKRSAMAAEENAAGVRAMAAAQQQAADKDDRQMQELQTLTSYTSQESERQSGALRHIAEVTASNSEGIKKILERLDDRQPVDIGSVVNAAITEYRRNEQAQGA
jgi:hypothetical protein